MNKKFVYTFFIIIIVLFIALSILFITGCCIFYGYRTYDYYHKTHDVVKSISLKDKLTALNADIIINEKDGYIIEKL